MVAEADRAGNTAPSIVADGLSSGTNALVLVKVEVVPVRAVEALVADLAEVAVQHAAFDA